MKRHIEAFWHAAICGLVRPSRAAQPPASTWPTPHEGDYTFTIFTFQSGETLVRSPHALCDVGKPVKDKNGRTTNADPDSPWYGRHRSSIPAADFCRRVVRSRTAAGCDASTSSSSRQHRPRKVIQAERRHACALSSIRIRRHDRASARIVREGFGVNHLRLILGTSMGCMHSWMWGETYPEQMDALMPLACLPVPDRRPEPYVAQDGHRWNSTGSRMERWRVFGPTACSVADCQPTS